MEFAKDESIQKSHIEDTLEREDKKLKKATSTRPNTGVFSFKRSKGAKKDYSAVKSILEIIFVLAIIVGVVWITIQLITGKLDLYNILKDFFEQWI